jgi:peptide/nickel transport system substrate-binding protein
MTRNPTPSKGGISRRSFLAAGATGGAVATAGCVDRVRSVVDQGGSRQLSLSIATVPAEADRQNVRIARRLESNLEAVGIDVSLDMRSPAELLEAVLLDHEFDVYVGRHPADYDPDFLYGALHSTFANEAGWQNPFGYTNMAFDALLEDQRRTDGQERRARVGSVLTVLAQEKPFDPICIPDEYRVARTDRFDGWDEGRLTTRHGYLGLEPADGVDSLHALVTDARVTRNCNPLSATGRKRDTFVDLLYDSLGSVRDGDVGPWLARSWEWEDRSDSETERSTASVTLRPECRFHDGEPVTATDVAFTYRFLRDTSLGHAPVPSPAPQYRGLVEPIENVTVEDDERLTITVTSGRAVAERAFTVPILPEHVWRKRVDERVTGEEFTAPQGRWDVVTADNVPPVGSGPFRFENRSQDESLTLRRFPDHFTLRADVDRPEPTVEEVRLSVDPSSASSIGRVADGGADVTASMLDAHSLGAIPDSSDVERLELSSRTFYHLGFNVRDAPFSNPHFRRAITQLIDKQAIVEEVFYGHATPASTPLTGEWVPEALEWDGADPVTPFVGSDGALNVEAARAAFETAGFRYDENGRLRGDY